MSKTEDTLLSCRDLENISRNLNKSRVNSLNSVRYEAVDQKIILNMSSRNRAYSADVSKYESKIRLDTNNFKENRYLNSICTNLALNKIKKGN